MGMVLLLMLAGYLGLVVLPAGLAVIVSLINSFRSIRFWASGACLLVVSLLVLPTLKVAPSDSTASSILGPEIATFISNVDSPVSRGLALAGVVSLVVGLLTFKKRWYILKGLSVGIFGAIWWWLFLIFRPV